MTKDNGNGRGRMEVAHRQRGCCFYCGGQFPTKNGVPPSQGGIWCGFVRDHLVPRSRGGLDANANRVAACTRCDKEKASRLPTDEELARQSKLLGRKESMPIEWFLYSDELLPVKPIGPSMDMDEQEHLEQCDDVV